MTEPSNGTIEWLLQGDPSVRWQVLRDLRDAAPHRVDEQRRLVDVEGWGADLLARQDPSGTWAHGLYTPKWTSTTYTLLLLWRLGLPSQNESARRGVAVIWDGARYFDGGLTAARTIAAPEACITSMYIGLASYFGHDDPRVEDALIWLLRNQLPDGGWNCMNVRFGDTHSSFHTSISALEALAEVASHGRTDVIEPMARGHQFFFEHRMYKSHRTGEVADRAFTRFSFPPQWHYDVLRGLDHLAIVNAPRDERCADAIDLVRSRRSADGTWPLQSPHRGRVWFDMEVTNAPSRWNTLRALRVLRWAGDLPPAP